MIDRTMKQYCNVYEAITYGRPFILRFTLRVELLLLGYGTKPLGYVS